MKKRIYETEVGTFTRATKREYSHIIVTKANDEPDSEFGVGDPDAWAGRLDLAQKQFNKINGAPIWDFVKDPITGKSSHVKNGRWVIAKIVELNEVTK